MKAREDHQRGGSNCKLEAIQQRLAEIWREEVSLPSIQQVLEENGLSEPKVRGVEGGGVGAELLGLEPERQLVLNLDRAGGPAVEGIVSSGGMGCVRSR